MIRTKDTLMVPGFGSESDCEDDVDDDFMKDPTRNGSSAFLGLGKSLGPDAPTNYNYGRRRSRAVLYQLSGHYKNTEKSNKKIHSKLSTNVSWQFFFFFFAANILLNFLREYYLQVIAVMSYLWGFLKKNLEKNSHSEETERVMHQII